MTDRELLEPAAKAAGITLHWPQDLGGADFLSPLNESNWKQWNPLTDDGDPYAATRRAIVRAAACRADGAVAVPARQGVRMMTPNDTGNRRCAHGR